MNMLADSHSIYHWTGILVDCSQKGHSQHHSGRWHLGQDIHSSIQTQVRRGKSNYDLHLLIVFNFEESNSSVYSSGVLYMCTICNVHEPILTCRGIDCEQIRSRINQQLIAGHFSHKGLCQLRTKLSRPKRPAISCWLILLRICSQSIHLHGRA